MVNLSTNGRSKQLYIVVHFEWLERTIVGQQSIGMALLSASSFVGAWGSAIVPFIEILVGNRRF
jgi:hypothetical protein